MFIYFCSTNNLKTQIFLNLIKVTIGAQKMFSEDTGRDAKRVVKEMVTASGRGGLGVDTMFLLKISYLFIIHKFSSVAYCFTYN